MTVIQSKQIIPSKNKKQTKKEYCVHCGVRGKHLGQLSYFSYTSSA